MNTNYIHGKVEIKSIILKSFNYPTCYTSRHEFSFYYETMESLKKMLEIQMEKNSEPFSGKIKHSVTFIDDDKNEKSYEIFIDGGAKNYDNVDKKCDLIYYKCIVNTTKNIDFKF